MKWTLVLESCHTKWQPVIKEIKSKWLKRYSLLVSNAANGVVLKDGSIKWKLP